MCICTRYARGVVVNFACTTPYRFTFVKSKLHGASTRDRTRNNPWLVTYSLNKGLSASELSCRRRSGKMESLRLTRTRQRQGAGSNQQIRIRWWLVSMSQK